jgi:tetratricopeptide (TPR) repeat protein
MNRIALLILCCFLFGVAASAQGMRSLKKKGTTRAVVVGISNYQDEGIKDLRYADRDAALFADFLKSKSGGELKDQQLKLLADGEATMAAIQSALQWLLQNSKKGDQAIIYFAGHGDVETKEEEEKGYLLAYDTPKNNYRLNAIDLHYLNHDIIGKLADQDIKVIVITDACHSGALAGEKIGGREATAAELMKRFSSEIKILSCQPYELSHEGPQWDGGRGVFSFYLINGLKGRADANRDQQVDLYELEDFLQERVRLATDKTQHPDVFGGKKQESLFWVDEAIAAELKAAEKTELEKDFEKDVLEKLATEEGYTYYLQFNRAIQKGNLLSPPGSAAVDYYDALYADTTFRLLRSIIDERLTVALLDSVQQAINAYLNTDPVELAQRDRFDKKYSRFPAYLSRAAKILGPNDARYRQTLAKQYYFEGLVYRLESEQGGGNDSLYQLALQKQQQALEYEDRAAYIYNELGLVLLAMGATDQAVDHFSRAIALSPTWALPHNNLGIGYSQKDSLDEARQYYLKAIELKPDLASAYTNLGNLYFNLEQADSAEMMYQRAIAHNPADKANYYFMGLLLSALDGRQSEAILFYQKALELDNDYPEVCYELGNWFFVGEQPDSAELMYKRAILLNPDFTEAYLFLGLLYFENNRLEEAEKMFLEAIRTNPVYLPAYECLVTQYQQEWDKAADLLQNAPLENFDKIYVLQQSGLTFMRSDAYDDAQRAFQMAVDLDPDEPLGYYAWCAYYSLLKQADKALDNLETALEKAQAREEDYFDTITGDEYLDFIRDQSQYRQIMTKYFPEQKID